MYFGRYSTRRRSRSKRPRVKRVKRAKRVKRVKGPALAQLQRIARANDVSIYKRKKDNTGFTRTPLKMSSLKSRLTRMKVAYKPYVLPKATAKEPEPWMRGLFDFGRSSLAILVSFVLTLNLV